MNCHEINYILDSNAANELPADQKKAVDRHFESCRACREAWAAYREVSALEIPRTPQDLHLRIATAVAPAESHPARRSLIGGGVLVFGAAVAASVTFLVKDGGPGLAKRIEEPAPVAAPAVPAGQEPAPLSAHRDEDALDADRPNEPGDSTRSRSDYVLDPNSIVVLPVPDRRLDPQRAAQFKQFYDELLRQLQSILGLNVAGPELVDPFLASGTPEEEIARGLGATHLVVLSATLGPREMMTITPVNAATGDAWGVMNMDMRYADIRWPAKLEVDVAEVVDFIEGGLTVLTPAERTAAVESARADARAIVLNAALPPAERVEALNRLPQGPEAPSDAIVMAAIELATIAPEWRANIWYAMYGVDNPYLIDPLLDSLAYDAAEHRRRAAAAALGTFVAEPRVKAALEQARASDASEAVREAARDALLTDEERDQLALQKLLDETLPARERLFATSIRAGRNVRSVPLTEEAARAVFDIGVTSTDPGIRASAWSRLGRDRVDDPSFMPVLVDDLANNPNDDVRAMAANALKQYAEDSAVRAALERAESDPSFQVRRAARRALGKIPD